MGWQRVQDKNGIAPNPKKKEGHLRNKLLILSCSYNNVGLNDILKQAKMTYTFFRPKRKSKVIHILVYEILCKNFNSINQNF